MSIARRKKSKTAPARRSRRIDYSDIPEADEEWFRAAKLERPDPKQRITVRLDRDVVAYFKKRGAGYQTRMNAALRAFMDAEKRSA